MFYRGLFTVERIGDTPNSSVLVRDDLSFDRKFRRKVGRYCRYLNHDLEVIVRGSIVFIRVVRLQTDMNGPNLINDDVNKHLSFVSPLIRCKYQ